MKIMVDGLPGKMATIIAKGILDDPTDRYSLMECALTWPGQPDTVKVGNVHINLIPPVLLRCFHVRAMQ